MFFGAGTIVNGYDKHNMRMIRGAMHVMPFTAVVFLAGTFAITGFPPFSIFMSELLIIIAAFLKGSYAVIAAVLFFLVLSFGAVIYHISRILFGRHPNGQARIIEPGTARIAYLFLLILIIVLGLAIPQIISEGIAAAGQIMRGI
jgi:hydrogenase-4 component F